MLKHSHSIYIYWCVPVKWFDIMVNWNQERFLIIYKIIQSIIIYYFTVVIKLDGLQVNAVTYAKMDGLGSLSHFRPWTWSLFYRSLKLLNLGIKLSGKPFRREGAFYLDKSLFPCLNRKCVLGTVWPIETSFYRFIFQKVI